MSIKLSEIETIVRGITIDQIEDGVPPAFGESDLVLAANTVKGDFWGLRPEAFVTGAVSVQPPSDLLSSRNALSFTRDVTSVALKKLELAAGADSLAAGILSLDFRTSEAGTLFYAGDGMLRYCVIKVTATGITVDIEDTENALSVSLELAGTFLNDRYTTVNITADGSDITITCNGDQATAAYTGLFLPYLSNVYLGYSDIAGLQVSFEGYFSAFTLSTSLGVDLHVLDFENGSGYTITETVNGYDADIFGPSVVWLTDDELAINQWALMTYCYGVAAFLLRQRGKDSFYRKAADSLHQLYVGR